MTPKRGEFGMSRDRREVEDNGNGSGGGVVKRLVREITKGNPAAIVVALLVMMAFLLGAFNKWGLESPLIRPQISAAAEQAARDSATTLKVISERLPESKKEHEAIRGAVQEQTEEISITNYILAECFRTRGDCPKLPRPKRLQDQIREAERRRGDQP